MPLEESLYPADWLRIAEKDLVRVERSLRDNDAEMAGFHLQQALEKLLKAFLLGRGWKLKRIHDLEGLLDDALAYDPTLERFRDACDKITNYYLLERYPFSTGSELTETEIRDSLEAARGLIDILRKASPGSR